MTDPNGLYYMRARYYHPGLKRFLNRDILAGDVTEGQTFNRFAYVNGDPVGFIDPLGLAGLGTGQCQKGNAKGISGAGEVVLPKRDTYEQARNQAFDIIGDLGADSKPTFGRLPSSKGYGKVIGRESANGKVRWRLDFDPKKGTHINVEDFRNGKGANATKIAIPFTGDENKFVSLLKHLNK
ncbi:RHS repeat-associated core domain-containing protein [Brevibacillus sp. VP]|nr:RHS repeat-associated core domain-containing protein [Brevibacillus sp. VP]